MPETNEEHIVIIMEKCSVDLKYIMEHRERRKQWFNLKEVIIIIGQIVKGYQSLYH